MSAIELTKAIAQNSEKQLLKAATKNQMPRRCRFYVACRQASTRWAWHTYLRKRLAVCDHCFETNEYLVPAKVKAQK